MTEIEFAELYYLTAGGLMNNFAIMSTIVTAYTLVGHFAAIELSRNLLLCITTVYSLLLFGPFVTYVSRLNANFEIRNGYFSLYPEGWAVPGSPVSDVGILFGRVIGNAPILLLWVISIYYVHIYLKKKK